MTVGEAIDFLSAFPRTMKLVRGDNSGGYEDVQEIISDEVTYIFPQDGKNAGDKETAVVVK